MSRLLSQDEVDALLASFEPEESSAPSELSETIFDLRAPIVLAGERLAMVQAACEQIAEYFAEAMTVLLLADKPIRGSFTGLVQQPATTVLGTLMPGEVLGLIVDEDGEPVGGVSLQPELGLALVDKIQGGAGRVQSGPRTLSAVEGRLLEGALSRIVALLAKRTNLAPIELAGLDHDPVFGRLANRGGMLATAQIRLATPFGDAVCRFLMTPVLTNRLVATPECVRSDETPARLAEALRPVPVRVTPVITGAALRLADLVQLAPGHVIQLDVREDEPLSLLFNGEPLARGGLRRREGERHFEITALSGEAPPAAEGA